MKIKNNIIYYLFLFFTLSIMQEAFGEEQTSKPEIGMWMGASAPFPGSPTAELLNTSMGFGLFTRFQWPFNLFYTELAAGYTNYFSNSERGLTVAPIFAALAYKLPFELPVSFFFKAGGGMAYVYARPANRDGWDPMLYGGFEASFVAGRKVRIGLRIDYDRVSEKHMKKPAYTEYYYSSPYDDPRLYNPKYYKMSEVEFFHFNLMLSILL